jgi:hypothetical protein
LSLILLLLCATFAGRFLVLIVGALLAIGVA